MSYMKELIAKAAELMCLGYTDHEIIRFLRVSPSQARELIEAAEVWNNNFETRNSTNFYSEDDRPPTLWRWRCI